MVVLRENNIIWMSHISLYLFNLNKEKAMLQYSVIFFVIAIVAAIFGFGGIVGSAAGIAKILFIGFLILAVLSLIFGRKR